MSENTYAEIIHTVYQKGKLVPSLALGLLAGDLQLRWGVLLTSNVMMWLVKHEHHFQHSSYI